MISAASTAISLAPPPGAVPISVVPASSSQSAGRNALKLRSCSSSVIVKKRLPLSSFRISFISSASSAKSKMSKFSRMCSGCVLRGKTIVPSCICQRKSKGTQCAFFSKTIDMRHFRQVCPSYTGIEFSLLYYYILYMPHKELQ